MQVAPAAAAVVCGARVENQQNLLSLHTRPTRQTAAKPAQTFAPAGGARRAASMLSRCLRLRLRRRCLGARLGSALGSRAGARCVPYQSEPPSPRRRKPGGSPSPVARVAAPATAAVVCAARWAARGSRGARVAVAPAPAAPLPGCSPRLRARPARLVPSGAPPPGVPVPPGVNRPPLAG